MANDKVSISMKSVLQATTNPYHDDEWATQTRQSSKRKATAFSFAALLGSLAVGLLLAIGHDLFYRSLEGRSINSVDLSQQWVSRIGTGFAFLVKASLVNAIIIAYTQRLWRNMQTRALEVGKIDHLMAAPTNILSLLHFAAFFQAPDLLVLGLTIWFLPLTAVVTPGTIVITDRQLVNTTNLQVPQLSFNGTAWATRLIGKTYFSYANPSDEVRRCALAAAMTGSVLNIPHSFSNSSYHLDFWGPTIQCSSANESITQAVDQAWWDSVGSGGAMTYLSWVGNDDHNILNDSYMSLSGQWETLDETSKDVARIFLAYNYNQGFDTIECQLHNSSYSVDFTFVNGQVSTSILSLAQAQPLPALRNVGTYDDDWMTGANGVHVSYQSVMDAFGKIFTGYAHTGGEKSSSMIQTSFSLTYVSWTDLNKTQRELEQLFQNMTLSMFSSPTLSWTYNPSLNLTQATYLPNTITSYLIVYSYDAKNLWLAYGISIFSTLLIVAVGVYSLMANKASYSGKFSTIVRSPKMSCLDSIISEQDDGSDPLPGFVRDTRVQVMKQDTLLQVTEQH